MTTLSPTVLKIVRSARLDKVGKPHRSPHLDDSWILTDAYIIFKELGVALNAALRKYTLEVSERQELAQEILTARAKLEQLMAENGEGNDQTGNWFLDKSKEWAEQLITPEFERLN